MTVIRADGGQLVMVGPRLEGGSLLWYDSVAARDRQLSLSEIQRVRFSNPGRAFNRGMKLGGAAGLVLGAIAFIGTAGNCQGGNCSVSSRLPLFGLALPVALIGGLAGTASPQVYVVSPATER